MKRIVLLLAGLQLLGVVTRAQQAVTSKESEAQPTSDCAQLPAMQFPALAAPSPPPDTADANTVAAGADLFGRYCSVCHGQFAVSGGITPDLVSPEWCERVAVAVAAHGSAS